MYDVAPDADQLAVNADDVTPDIVIVGVPGTDKRVTDPDPVADNDLFVGVTEADDVNVAPLPV